MNNLKQAVIDLIEHLCNENILEPGSIDYDQSLVQLVESIKTNLQNIYPETVIRKPVKSIHYANNFDDGGLKNIAFLLDDISQLLYFNGLLDQERVVEFFNSEVSNDSFDFSPINLVTLTVKGLCAAKK